MYQKLRCAISVNSASDLKFNVKNYLCNDSLVIMTCSNYFPYFSLSETLSASTSFYLLNATKSYIFKYMCSLCAGQPRQHSPEKTPSVSTSRCMVRLCLTGVWEVPHLIQQRNT